MRLQILSLQIMTWTQTPFACVVTRKIQSKREMSVPPRTVQDVRT